MCVISNSGCGSRTRATHNYSGPSVTTRHGQLRFVVARLYSLRLSATIPYCLPVVGSINLESFGFFSKKNTHTHTKINLKSEAVLWTWRRALLTAAAIYLFPELLSSAGRWGIRGQGEKVPSTFWFDRKLQLPYCTCRANLVTLHWAIC